MFLFIGSVFFLTFLCGKTPKSQWVSCAPRLRGNTVVIGLCDLPCDRLAPRERQYSLSAPYWAQGRGLIATPMHLKGFASKRHMGISTTFHVG